jgi:hypothetical protein
MKFLGFFKNKDIKDLSVHFIYFKIIQSELQINRLEGINYKKISDL